MSLAAQIFDRMSDNEGKYPLYYRNEDTIDKENKELKRSINTMQKMKDDGTTRELLSIKDFAALEKGLASYCTLLHKRERASQNNRKRSEKKRRKEERGARWIRSSFEKVDIELMLKVIYARSSRASIWSFYEDRIEEEFMYILKSYGLHMETRTDAEEHVKKFYKAISDTTHPAYVEWEHNVKKALEKYRETIT